jgi:hypothetical protein
MSKPSWIELSPEQQAEFGQLVPSETWRRVPREALPSAFPSSLRSRIDSAVMVSTMAPNGHVYLAYSADRVDLKDDSIDVEPFGVAMLYGRPPSSGLFLHHGSWPGRTAAMPDGLLEFIEQSQVGNYFLAHPPEGKVAGQLHELSRGHRGAFDEVVRRLVLSTQKTPSNAG